ncbi:hypothetical protein J4Q44_G00300410 [Coregonus suidteri]|uniref:Uncharacterized protein n=1 Tax=Coregonus suidteri TaxID=861788 RepID=A0AAN8KXM1_9TELE
MLHNCTIVHGYIVLFIIKHTLNKKKHVNCENNFVIDFTLSSPSHRLTFVMNFALEAELHDFL